MSPRDDIVLLGHGSGGRMSQRLIEEIIVPELGAAGQGGGLEDATRIAAPHGDLYFTTDSYVVDPIFFPGGNIGDLAINGTVNDLAMRGAQPLALSVGLILEEGLPIKDLRLIVCAMGNAAIKAGVKIVCGDTKVTPRGSSDKIFINTAGVGTAKPGTNISAANAAVGDVVILSGTLADHGATIMLARDEFEISGPVKSDSAGLNKMVMELIENDIDIHVMRDPTRGGLATSMVEIAESSGVSISLDERAIPMNRAVAGACELLGLDPLMVANEGKMVLIAPARESRKIIDIMKNHAEGKEAAIIGEVTEGVSGQVTVTSQVGGTRMVTRLEGELLPRIC